MQTEGKWEMTESSIIQQRVPLALMSVTALCNMYECV